jgi:hypothetical protein
MTDLTIINIVESARSVDPQLQGQWIAERAIAAARAADADISDQALEAEYAAWFQREYGRPPHPTATALGIAWGRHLLSRGSHGH